MKFIERQHILFFQYTFLQKGQIESELSPSTPMVTENCASGDNNGNGFNGDPSPTMVINL
jgi:hypothetical protein